MTEYNNPKPNAQITERLIAKAALLYEDKDSAVLKAKYDYITNHDITWYYDKIRKHLIESGVDNPDFVTKVLIENIIVVTGIITGYDIEPEELIWGLTDMDNDVNHFTIDGKPTPTHLFLNTLYESSEIGETIKEMYSFVTDNIINVMMSVTIIPLNFQIHMKPISGNLETISDCTIIIGHLSEDLYQEVLLEAN